MDSANLKFPCIWLTVLLLAGCGQDKPQRADVQKDDDDPAVKAQVQPTKKNVLPTNNDTTPTPKRGPKRHDPLVSLPESPKPALDRLRKEYSGIDPASPAAVQKISQLWWESVAQLQEIPLASAREEAVSKGVLLPKEFSAPRITDISTDNPSAMLDALGFVALGHSGLLSDLARLRVNALPPSKADIAIFDSIHSALGELDSLTAVGPFEPWEKFATAKNPIYRLLGVRAAIYTTSRAAAKLPPDDPNRTLIDAPAKLAFFLRYMSESDPAILAEAVTAMGAVPLPEARRAIETFLKERERQGDAALVQVASDALRTHDAVTQAAHR